MIDFTSEKKNVWRRSYFQNIFVVVVEDLLDNKTIVQDENVNNNLLNSCLLTTSQRYIHQQMNFHREIFRWSSVATCKEIRFDFDIRSTDFDSTKFSEKLIDENKKTMKKNDRASSLIDFGYEKTQIERWMKTKLTEEIRLFFCFSHLISSMLLTEVFFVFFVLVYK